MKEILIKGKEKLLLLAGFFVVALSSWATCNTLIANIFYEKAIKASKPELFLEKVRYYREAINNISKASQLQKMKAEYYTDQADYLLGARDDDLKEYIDFDKARIENLYLNAIKINPLGFDHHLKLGWFYASIGDKRAEEELLKATELYPSNYRTHQRLAQFYIEEGKNRKSLNSLLRYFSTVDNSPYSCIRYMKDFGEYLHDLPYVSPDISVAEFGVILYPDNNEFYFKKYKFPHIKFNLRYLKFRVYFEQVNSPKVFLVNKGFKKIFSKVENESGLLVQELILQPVLQGAYFDEFEIRADKNSQIKKLEIILSTFGAS